MAHIVIIEDEADLREILEYNLRQGGHTVQAAARGTEGLDACRRRLPDLVLLDIMLPDVSGTEVCKVLRRDEPTRNVPILMLTAKSEEVDRVVGFELGADDYVSKPFSMRELMLRVQALLRRARPPEPAERAVVEFGAVRVDRDAHRVWVEGREVDLTALEFRLLVLLLERRDRVQSREMLLEDVWGMSADVTTRTVDTHIKRLREKLGAAAAYVQTVRGAGYRFAGTPGEQSDR